jgi:UbiD family decarboxylase
VLAGSALQRIGLQQSPLALVKCITHDLHVPADAEFVLEGFVPPRNRVNEGPFGEFTGYSTGSTTCPMFKVQAITSRREPIFQDIVSGHAEHLLLPVLGMEHHLLETARAVAPSVASVKISLPLTVFVSLRKEDDEQPRRLIAALLTGDIYAKQVVVVDSDVDISDLRQVATAVALNIRPDRDIHIFPPSLGSELDPSSESSDGLTAKYGLDATRALKSSRQVVKNRVPQHVLDSINLSEFLQTN